MVRKREAEKKEIKGNLTVRVDKERGIRKGNKDSGKGTVGTEKETRKKAETRKEMRNKMRLERQ